MLRLSACVLLILCIPAVFSTSHTVCYNYFLQKDRCVFASADNKTRCQVEPKPHPNAVEVFALKPGSGHQQQSALQRRYDTTKPVFNIGGGNGICGSYDSNATAGICLWSGAEQTNPTSETAGWLNGLKTSNCHKKIYIQRAGKKGTVQYATVLDGCSFNEVKEEKGCFEVGVTLKLFEKFNPTEEERKANKLLGGLTWDFDNLDGAHPEQGPV